MGECVCVHIFKGLWPIAPGHQTLFYQAWTHTKTDPLMLAAWVEIYMRTSLKHTHPFRDPRPRHERSTGYTSITLHNVPFTVAWITSRSFHVCRTKTHVASCELHAFLFYLVPAEIKRRNQLVWRLSPPRKHALFNWNILFVEEHFYVILTLLTLVGKFSFACTPLGRSEVRVGCRTSSLKLVENNFQAQERSSISFSGYKMYMYSY